MEFVQVRPEHADQLLTIYVARGIARALMLAAMDRLAEQGCTVCWLITAADNWAAQSLYYALGFDEVDGSVSFRKNLGGSGVGQA